MLRSMKDMEDYTIGATDGIIGQVKDFYFDDESWVIRYLVVETGETAPRRRVLISPIAIGRPNWSEKILPVSITRLQVANSPDIDTDKPVSRQQEMGYLGYYGYGDYWGGGGLWGAGLYPDTLQAGWGIGSSADYQKQGTLNAGMNAGMKVAGGAGGNRADPHLRSGNAVMRYYVHANDGDIGHVVGLIVDEKSWAIRYLVVNTSNWWMGHDVLIAPEWIDDVDWAESMVAVGLTRHAIKTSPPYDPATSLDREQEASIHTHYGRDGYWPREAKHAGTGSRLHR
jgi:hypothetical protein